MISINFYSRTNQMMVDACIFAASLAAAYAVRFTGIPQWPEMKQFLLILPYFLLARLVVNWACGIYYFVWRYINLSDSVAIARSLTVVSLALIGLQLFYPSSWIFADRLRLSLRVIVFEYVFSLSGAISARAFRRLVYEHRTSNVAPARNPKRMLLYGAGNAGILLAREVKHRAAVGIVGFLDDDPRKAAAIIAGTRVLGSGDSLEKIVQQRRVDEVVITMLSPRADLVRRVLAKCQEISVPLKIIPDVQKILLGHASIGQIHDIRLEDLLGRECVDVTRHENTIRQMYSGKRILVTGAGGSIGSELVRQLMLFEPQSVILLDKDENSVYELQQELHHNAPGALFEPRVADIRHAERVRAIFRESKPQIVFHAAAHKHVPLMECNPCEAILNNILGTEVLLQLCREWDIEQFVYISSDKAVYPSNVMGATKRIGELMVRNFANDGNRSAACVRFGNVLGSRGSVIPLFQKQIARGGPITVTHPEVSRYFMTISEAVRLVLCAGTLGTAGETFVLDMGVPRKILDIAYEMIALAGLRREEMEIRITGLRSGEKLYEELVESGEALHSTNVEKLRVVVSDAQNKNFSLGSIAQLINAARQNDRSRVYGQLFDLGIGFQPDMSKGDVPMYCSAAAPGSTKK